MNRPYAKEFPLEAKPPQELIDLVDADVLKDNSWHNDICPHFEATLIERPGDEESTLLHVWSDWIKPEEREYPDCKRFRVFILEDETQTKDWHTVCETNDVHEAVHEALQTIAQFKGLTDNVDVIAVANRLVTILTDCGFPDISKLCPDTPDYTLDDMLGDRGFMDLVHEAFRECQPQYYFHRNAHRADADWRAVVEHATALLREIARTGKRPTPTAQDSNVLARQSVLRNVQEALDHAEGMYGPEGIEYLRLMEDVITEAQTRIQNAREQFPTWHTENDTQGRCTVGSDGDCTFCGKKSN